MKNTVRAACSFFLVLLLSAGLPNAWSAPPGSAEWEAVPELTDEFETSSMDRAKWKDDLTHFKGKQPGLHQQKNNVFNGNEAILWTRAENVPNSPPGYRNFTTATFAGRKMMHFGYIEVRAKISPSKANNALALYRWTPTGTYEIDVFEIGGTSTNKQNIIHTNTHVYLGNPELENDQNRMSSPRRWAAPVALKDDYHLYGFEWNELEIKWYFDGNVIRSEPNRHFQVPMYVNLSTETHGDWFGLPSADELPAAYKVDYVRTWRRKMNSATQKNQ